jgi:hypothetical protein
MTDATRPLKMICPHCTNQCTLVTEQCNGEYSGRVQLLIQDYESLLAGYTCDWCHTSFVLPASITDKRKPEEEPDDSVDSRCPQPMESHHRYKLGLLGLIIGWWMGHAIIQWARDVHATPTLDCGTLVGIGRTTVGSREYLIACPTSNMKETHEEAQEAQGSEAAAGRQAASTPAD